MEGHESQQCTGGSGHGTLQTAGHEPAKYNVVRTGGQLADQWLSPKHLAYDIRTVIKRQPRQVVIMAHLDIRLEVLKGIDCH